MKTKYLIPALMLVMLAGCNKEQAPVQEPPVEPQKEQKGTAFAFSSSMGDVTKVTLNADNSLFWAAGDKIGVYAYKGDAKVQSDVASLSGGEGTGVGTFTPGTYAANTDWFIAEDGDSQEYAFYAFYPGGDEAPALTDKIKAVSVAASQLQSVGIGKYIVSYAAASTTKQVLASGAAPNFAFAPKSALLKLTIRNSAPIPVRISSVKISSSANMAGSATLNLGTGVLSDGDATAITYTFANPIEIAAGAVASAPVYISMLPCAPGSLTVSLNQAGFKYTVAAISLAEVESGHVYAKEAVISDVSRELRVRNEVPSGTLADADGLGTDHYYGAANCLVIAANATQGILDIALKKSGGNFARSNTDPTKVNAVTMAKVIWAEDDLYNDPAFCISDGNQNRLVISKTAGVSGNALIGIYKESELLWSYHIWCPIDDSVMSVTSEGSSTKFTAYKLALGQIQGSDNDTYMYYQWGRKDPLGRSASLLGGSSLEDIHGASFTGISAASTSETSNNLAYARKNPTVFIYNVNETLYDWYPSKPAMTELSDQNNNLWISSAATFNDPCPQGYRVAPKTLWDGSTGKAAGPLFSSAGLWYVLGGYRNRTGGGVNYVSSYGYYWSSEVVSSSVKAYILGFNSGSGLDRAGENYRAYGFGVRCVK